MSRYLFAALIWVACATTAAGGVRSLERAMETNTQAISLPETAPASIDARGCLQCQSVRLELPQTARYFVGNTEVSLKELRAFALGKNYDMVIFYELDSNVIVRIVVSAVWPKPATR